MKCWLKSLIYQKKSNIFQETPYRKVLSKKSEFAYVSYTTTQKDDTTNLAVVVQNTFIWYKSRCCNWTTYNIFICLELIVCKIQTNEVSGSFYLYRTADDNEMTYHLHCNDIVCYHYTSWNVCVCLSVAHLMYLMKKSPKVLFPIFLQARWQNVENRLRYMTINTNSSKRSILKVCWLLSLNICSKMSNHND